ncbi:hypothetical protein KP509_03G058400 [Ceratopteris richardii]|uniref:Uncharacterized protein n=1 Tax=Ceratopteris richardii TaxID=49495 RepID=A0A8T2V3S6_CERRI|nr:hypothetical protein KP509_03G058400 [Ceratopteris richardii]
MKPENGDNVDEPRSTAFCINDVVTDDVLRTILSKLPAQSDKDACSLVCKRWLRVQSMERQRLCARAGIHMLERIALRFTHLVNLDFTQSTSRSFFPGVGDKDLLIVASNFPLLEKINLCLCKGVTDSGLEALGSGTSTLRSVDLTDCVRITDKGIEALAQGCSQLQVLRLSGCKLVTDKALESLGKFSKQLAELNIQRCIKVTDTGTSFLFQGCKSLNTLDLSMCTKIASLGLQRFSGLALALRNVNFCGCSKIENEAIKVLSGCASLEQVRLNGCRMVTDEGIIELLNCCGPMLKVLDLGWLNLSDQPIRLIFSLCPGLVILNLESCSRVTDHGFTATNINNLVLRELYMSKCPGITIAGVMKIVNSCTQLQSLDLRFCDQLDPNDVRSLLLPQGCHLLL